MHTQAAFGRLEFQTCLTDAVKNFAEVVGVVRESSSNNGDVVQVYQAGNEYFILTQQGKSPSGVGMWWVHYIVRKA